MQLATLLNYLFLCAVVTNFLVLYIVNGGWSDWEYGACTKTCGGGIMSMIRKCSKPEPSCGGNNCTGSSVFALKTLCNDFCCPSKILA